MTFSSVGWLPATSLYTRRWRDQPNSLSRALTMPPTYKAAFVSSAFSSCTPHTTDDHFTHKLKHRYKPKFHSSLLDVTRHVRRVKPMHFGCVELVEQHGSTQLSRVVILWQRKDKGLFDGNQQRSIANFHNDFRRDLIGSFQSHSRILEEDNIQNRWCLVVDVFSGSVATSLRWGWKFYMHLEVSE